MTRIICTLLWIASFCLTLPAVEVERQHLQVRAHIPWSNQESYTPVIVHLESNLADTISLRLVHSKTVKAFRDVEVKAGIKKRVTVLIPSSLNDVDYAQIFWTSKETGKVGQVSCSQLLGYRQATTIVVGRDQSLQGNEFLSKLPEPNYNRYSSNKYQDMESEHIPSYWQGIPHWLCIILTPSGDKLLDAGQRKALKQWAHSGGQLFITEAKLHKSWLAGAPCTLVNNNLRDGIQLLYEAVRKQNQQVNAGIVQYQVPGTDEVPSGIFVSIMILFVIIVGPVNYLWVRKKKQIHLFLITTPIISFIFCITMATFGILADGLSAYRSTVELTWIDHQRKQACHWTSVSWFSGLSPGDIEVGHDTAVQIMDNSIYSDYLYDTHPLEARWFTKQILSGDWIRTRTHQQLQYATPQGEERRFLIKKDGGSYQIENGFDIAIRSFEWRDQQGLRWQAQDIQSGERKALTLISNEYDAQHDLFKNVDRTLRRFDAHVLPLWNGSLQALHFRAQMENAVYDIPGPTAEDVETPLSFICGRLGVSP